MSADIHPISPLTKAIIKARAESELAHERLTTTKRTSADRKQNLVSYVLAEAELSGVKPTPIVDHLLARAKAGDLTPYLHELLYQGAKDKLISRATLLRHVRAYKDSPALLVPKHKGRLANVYGWEARALHYLNQSSNNNPGNITSFLQQDGWVSATKSRVRAWYNRLPADIQNNRGRLGELAFNSTMRSHKRRHTNTIEVGQCYQSDGNLMPIYLQHPTGKRPARFEITPCIDIKSRFLAGYRISTAESSYATLHALSDAITRQNHVPDDLQADNGPGFSNTLVSRFYNKIGIIEAHPRAYNPQDNGYIERWHQTLQEEHLKRLPGYCGDDAAPEPLKRYLKKVAKGEAIMLSLEQFIERLDKFIHWYNHGRVHESLDGRTPADLWAQLQPNPPVNIADAIFWDQTQRTVRRCSITLMKLEYENPALMAYNGRKVLVDYNVYNGDLVRIRDLEGRLICDADRIKAVPYRYDNIAERNKKILDEQKIKRIDAKREETLLRANMVIDHTADLVASLEASEQVTRLEPLEETVEAPAGTEDLDIDLTSTDY